MSVKSRVWELFTRRIQECYPECFVNKKTGKPRKTPSGTRDLVKASAPMFVRRELFGRLQMVRTMKQNLRESH